MSIHVFGSVSVCCSVSVSLSVVCVCTGTVSLQDDTSVVSDRHDAAATSRASTGGLRARAGEGGGGDRLARVRGASDAGEGSCVVADALTREEQIH